MKDLIKYLLLAAVAIGLGACRANDIFTVSSPDGDLVFSLKTDDGRAFYRLERNGTPVLAASRLGLKFRECDLSENLRIARVNRSSCDEVWTQPWGEDAEVRNRYNELLVEFTSGQSPVRLLLNVRVFDDGVGFRYAVPGQEGLDSLTLMDEITEFALVEDARCWSIPSNRTVYYEGIYTEAPVSRLDTVCTPLTLQAAPDLFLTVHEAALTDYAKMNLTTEAGSTTLRCDLTPWSTGEKVFACVPMLTPWRTVIVADKPGDLILSRLMLNLNEPCRIEDTSWIAPGRYIGIWWAIHMEKYSWCQGPKHGATTANVERYIDFAAAHGFSGVLAEGWNKGWDGDWSKDGALFRFTEPTPDFDLAEVTRHAAEKGVRFIGHNETGGATLNYEEQLEEAFALYEKLGINTVKTGYVNALLDGRERHDSQYGVRHYRKVIEAAARHRLMIDNHEPVMPTGLQRTYPNLMTQEGVRGQEYNAWSGDGGNPPSHTATLPFTRGLAGPMDYTPNVFDHRNNVRPGTHPGTTNAAELALNVVLFSPLQMAADMIENYENLPAFEFVTSCPTTWAQTVVPEACIGEYVTIARKDRGSENWFVGSLTNEHPRDVRLALSFLTPGTTYRAKIFADGPGAHYRDDPYPVRISECDVDASSVLDLHQAPGGGTAIMLIKK